MRKALPIDYNVGCPLCGAEPRQECINIGQGSRFQGEVHRERRQLAEARYGV